MELHPLVDACIRVAQRVQDEVVLAWTSDLKAELFLHKTAIVQDPFEVHDSLFVLLLDQEEPPLFDLRLWVQRSVHRSHGLVLAEVLPAEPHRAGGDVANDYLALVLHGDLGFDLHLPDVSAEGVNVCKLVSRHAVQQRLSPLRIALQELGQRGDRIPVRGTLLDPLLVEVRDLKQLGAPDVEGLHQAATELDHGLSGGKPLAHAGDLDHGLCHLHGVPQQLVNVTPELK
mmetsp:Transcript_34154/g.86711  ORF Transcript_34154/g.86711 Transcript_34154/m.86711 type:complete len:230 (+) Transcript_34154:382-1071(+)